MARRVTAMLRIAFALPLVLHGLAHLSGFVSSWTASSAGFADRPWIVSAQVTLGSPLGRVFGLLWLLGAAALIASAIGLVSGQAWWPEMAVAGSAISLVVIIPWWNTVPPGARIGAAFDLVVILSLVLLRERILDWIA